MNDMLIKKTLDTVYFDHAATSWPKPPTVLRAVKTAITRCGGNPGRSGHRLSMAAADTVYATRERVAQLLSQPNPEMVTFTQNATYALNMAIKGAVSSACHVLISDIEHNATLRPLHALARCGLVEYSTFSSEGDIEKNVRSALRRDTRLIVSTLASNVSGREIPLSVLADVRRQTGIYTIVDASQMIGHAPIDLSAHAVDVLCAPGHKGLLGIPGCGFAVYQPNDAPNTWIEGGSGNESRRLTMPSLLPERMEPGTLPTPSIASLCAGIEYISEIGVDNIRQNIGTMTNVLCNEMKKLTGVRLIDRVGHGILSFVCESMGCEEMAAQLDRKGICVRSGLQCAPLAHETFGTVDTGVVRVSLSFLNTEAQVDYFLRTLYQILHA